MNALNLNRAQYQAHPFHLVEPSPWPLLTSFALLVLTTSAVMWFQGFPNAEVLLAIGFTLVVGAMTLWFRDVITEGTLLGDHTFAVQNGLTLGFALFVISEVFFFLSVFWAYFHSALAPTVELGAVWPPKGIEALDPYAIPLLNTALLLSSGATITYAHHSVIYGERYGAIAGTLATIVLAVIFTGFQMVEYYDANFTIADGVYGSTFFFATGFHGVHVIVGSLFLTVGLFRIINYHLTDHHHIGYESAILYWHFVDVVWLLLYVSIYWWGS